MLEAYKLKSVTQLTLQKIWINVSIQATSIPNQTLTLTCYQWAGVGLGEGYQNVHICSDADIDLKTLQLDIVNVYLSQLTIVRFSNGDGFIRPDTP